MSFSSSRHSWHLWPLSIVLVWGLTAAARAGGPAGGDQCMDATPLSLPGSSGMGSTVGATDTVSSVAMDCLEVPVGGFPLEQTAGLDHIYTFTVDSPGLVTVDATTQDVSYDLQLYILSTCGDGSSCVVGADVGCSIADGSNFPCNGSPAESISMMLDAGTYFLYVDSFASAAGGGYTLDLPEPVAGGAGLAALAALLGCAARRRRARERG